MTTLNLFEVVGVVSTVTFIYIVLFFIASRYFATSENIFDNKSDFWGFLPSRWDHPEPNYIYSDYIAEFWSVITTIPYAGTLLLYNASKQNFGIQVLLLYIIITWMYSCAFFAHMTLSPLIMSMTLTSVLLNGTYTFHQFAYILSDYFKSIIVRTIICIIALSIIIKSVIELPIFFGKYGGVITLTVVQTPAVLLATFIANKYIQYYKNEDRNILKLLRNSGILLVFAMAVSFIEILNNRSNCYNNVIFEAFPHFHMIIHISEQIGIYCYGTGVGALKYKIIEEETNCKINYFCGFMPYVDRGTVEKKYINKQQ